MSYLLIAVALIVAFVAGKSYGARVEEEAVEAALYAFTRARALFVSVAQKALADVKAKEERLKARVEKYL